jgi:hypothetical protein
MEYTEIYYCKENDKIKLTKNGAFYRIISQTNTAIMLINLTTNTSRLVFKNDYPKIYICKDSQ